LPVDDKYIAQTFTIDTLEQRKANKIALQEEVGLKSTPVFDWHGNEAGGTKELICCCKHWIGFSYTDAQFFAAETGDRYYSQMWQMASRYPGRMMAYLLYNAPSSTHHAGSDAFHASRFEPCGISWLYIRLSADCTTHRGLVDTVLHHDPTKHTGTGYFAAEPARPLHLHGACLGGFQTGTGRGAAAARYETELQLEELCQGICDIVQLNLWVA